MKPVEFKVTISLGIVQCINVEIKNKKVSERNKNAPYKFSNG